MSFTLSPVRVGVAVLSGALATGIFHAAQQGRGTSAIAAALGAPTPAAPTTGGHAARVGPAFVPAPTKPIAVKAAPTKPIAVKAAPTKPIDVKPAPTKPIAVKAAPTKPIAARPAPARPIAARPGQEKRPQDNRPQAKPAQPAPIAVTKAPKRFVFRHSSPGVVILTLQGDQVDVEFKEGR